MTFLPIVERELRVAARKRSTFWLRVVAALVALVIGGGFYVLTSAMSSMFGSAGLGKALFAVLTWLSLAAVLSAGLFFTSDCLSEEKRDGTLGFLFLTDLRGYDVVLGKLLATSLRSFYALLAIFPILAITLLMGGVTASQFWMTLLALINALFYSLAAGMFVSAISRDSQRALAATFLLLLAVVAAGPVIDGTFAAVKGRGFTPVLSLTSPGYLFVTAGGRGPMPFWLGVIANQAVAWALLGLASLLLPRTWQERRTKISAAKETRTYAWKFGRAKSRRALRKRLIELNPVLWLACRERWQSWAFWLVSLLMATGVTAVFVSHNDWVVLGVLWSVIVTPLTWILYLGIASRAGRFFVEAQRSGLIELLLATPLTVNQIVQGQWRALLRMFGTPLTLLVVAQLLSAILVQQRTWSKTAAVTPATPTVTPTTNGTTNTTFVTTRTVTKTVWEGIAAVSPGSSFGGYNEIVMLVLSVAGTLTFVANLAALSWFGMWMGLNSKSNHLATLKTIVFVQIIPWFVVSFASVMIVPLLMLLRLGKGFPSVMPQMMTWYPLVISALATVLYLTKDIVFSLWARRKLYSEFREQAVRSVSPILPVLPPPSPSADLSPVIAPNSAGLPP